MLLAHQTAARNAFGAPHPSPARADGKVRISIQGKLGFDCWKAVVDARRLASEKGLALQVDVTNCNSADMAGIGALLIAIDKLGDIEVAGCTELSRYWFGNLGVCRGCRSFGSPACPNRARHQADAD